MDISRMNYHSSSTFLFDVLRFSIVSLASNTFSSNTSPNIFLQPSFQAIFLVPTIPLVPQIQWGFPVGIVHNTNLLTYLLLKTHCFQQAFGSPQRLAQVPQIRPLLTLCNLDIHLRTYLVIDNFHVGYIYYCLKSKFNNLMYHFRISCISRKCRLCSISIQSTVKLISTAHRHNFITLSDFVNQQLYYHEFVIFCVLFVMLLFRAVDV